MRRKRAGGAVMIAGVAVILAVGASVARHSSSGPAIEFRSNVPEDVRIVARSAWERFTAAFPARWGCLPDVTVSADRGLADRGHYEPSHRLVTVRIPGTAPNLTAALIHEFAHHLELSCPDAAQLRMPFLAAQGFPPGTAWSEGPTWERTPSEQFAEATVQVVLGRVPHPRVFVGREALEAIRAWAGGR